jgi:hypothetical protein
VFNPYWDRLVSGQQILFAAGCVAVVAGILLLVLGVMPWVISPEIAEKQHTEEIEEIIVVSPPSNHKTLSLRGELPFFLLLGEIENTRIEGYVSEVDNYTFDFYLLTRTNYELWKIGKSHDVYFHGENQASYDFSVSPSPEDFKDLYFLIEGENLAVRLSVTARWTETSIFGLGILGILGKMMFIIYGIFCLGGGLLLILIFRKRKEGIPQL